MHHKIRTKMLSCFYFTISNGIASGLRPVSIFVAFCAEIWRKPEATAAVDALSKTQGVNGFLQGVRGFNWLGCCSLRHVRQRVCADS